MKFRTDIQKNGQILQKHFFTNICENRKMLIKNSYRANSSKHISNEIEYKILSESEGWNRVKFHFELFSKFSNRKKRLRDNYETSWVVFGIAIFWKFVISARGQYKKRSIYHKDNLFSIFYSIE